MGNNQGFSKFPREKTFNFDYTVKEENQTFSGIFTVKRPTMVDQVAIEAEKSKMLGGRYYDDDNPGVGVTSFASQMAEAVSFLRVCLTSYPDWWNNGDVYNPGLLIAVYEEARKIDPFRTGTGGNEGGDRGTSGKDSNRESNQTGHDDVLASMVDEEI